MHGEHTDLLVGHAQCDGYRLERAAAQYVAARTVHVFLAQHADTDQPGQCAIQRLAVAHLLANHFELVGGPVLGQHIAIAIQNQAAVGRDGFDAGTITFGLVGVVVVAHHLQQNQSAEQQQHQRDDCERRHRDAPEERALFPQVILDAHAA